MHIKEAIESLQNKKFDQMREHINTALAEKAMQKLDERKIEIAKNYFGKPKG